MKKVIRILAAVCAVVMLFSSFAFSASAAMSKSDISAQPGWCTHHAWTGWGRNSYYCPRCGSTMYFIGNGVYVNNVYGIEVDHYYPFF